jgi:hypothetical protein
MLLQAHFHVDWHNCPQRQGLCQKASNPNLLPSSCQKNNYICTCVFFYNTLSKLNLYLLLHSILRYILWSNVCSTVFLLYLFVCVYMCVMYKCIPCLLCTYGLFIFHSDSISSIIIFKKTFEKFQYTVIWMDSQKSTFMSHYTQWQTWLK